MVGSVEVVGDGVAPRGGARNLKTLSIRVKRRSRGLFRLTTVARHFEYEDEGVATIPLVAAVAPTVSLSTPPVVETMWTSSLQREARLLVREVCETPRADVSTWVGCDCGLARLTA